METRSHWSSAVAIAICALSLTFATVAARSKSASYDEPKHVATGAYAWTAGNFLGDDNAPIVSLFGWPARLNEWHLPAAPTELTPTGKRLGLYEAGVAILTDRRNGESVVDTLFEARLTSLALFALLLLGVALEARTRGGDLGMLVALGLVALSPAMLSHASIVSADLPLAVAGVFVVIATRRYTEQPSVARASVLGIALGGALATKLTGVVFVLGAAIWLLSWALRSRSRFEIVRDASAVVVAGLIVITLATNFDPLFFVRQWRLVSNYGTAHQTEYFLGSIGSRSPWFYPAVLVAKLEPALQVGLVMLAITIARDRKLIRTAGGVLLLAFLVFVVTCASGYRQGFRFLLPMWPLLAIACAHGFDSSRTSRMVAGFLLVCAGATSLSAAPNFLTYWNPLTRGSGDSWFVDSNHDWGQDLSTLARWHQENPDAMLYGALYTIVPPEAYGIRFTNLFDDPSTLTRFDPTQRNVLVISVTLLRMLAADPRQPLNGVVNSLSAEQPDLEFGGSIRGYELSRERLSRLMAKR